MKKLFFLLSLFTGFVLFGCSSDDDEGSGKIYGVVSHAETGEPVSNANVIVSPGNISTVTGNDGHYECIDLHSGQYSIQVMSNGFQTNSRQITIKSGESYTNDFSLHPIIENTNFHLSSNCLNFGGNSKELALTIYNVGNSGVINWHIMGNDLSWLSFSKESGSLEMGKSQSIIVKIDRSMIQDNETSLFTIEAAGSSAVVNVIVLKNGTVIPGDENEQDFSSAQITQCDSRIDASITSCQRGGSSVILRFRIINKGIDYTGTGGYFRFLERETAISDNHSSYPNYKISFADGPTLSKELYKNVPYNGSVTIKNVDPKAKTINVILRVENVYADNLASEFIEFKNVPIH